MPLYEYQCQTEKTRFEVIQKFSDSPVEVCPTCGGPVKRLLSSPAIQFKGTGWYITDYARKGSTDGARDGNKDSGKDGKSSSSTTGSESGSSKSSTTPSGSGSSSGSGSGLGSGSGSGSGSSSSDK